MSHRRRLGSLTSQSPDGSGQSAGAEAPAQLHVTAEALPPAAKPGAAPRQPPKVPPQQTTAACTTAASSGSASPAKKTVRTASGPSHRAPKSASPTRRAAPASTTTSSPSASGSASSHSRTSGGSPQRIQSAPATQRRSPTRGVRKGLVLSKAPPPPPGSEAAAAAAAAGSASPRRTPSSGSLSSATATPRSSSHSLLSATSSVADTSTEAPLSVVASPVALQKRLSSSNMADHHEVLSSNNNAQPAATAAASAVPHPVDSPSASGPGSPLTTSASAPHLLLGQSPSSGIPLLDPLAMVDESDEDSEWLDISSSETMLAARGLGEAAAMAITMPRSHSTPERNSARFERERELMLEQAAAKKARYANEAEAGLMYLLHLLENSPGREEELAQICMRLGTVAEAQNKIDAATHFKHKALLLFHRMGHARRESAARVDLAVSLCCLGEYDKALKCLRRTLKVCRENKDKLGEMVACEWLGRTFASRNQNTRALDFYRRLVLLSRELNDREAEMEACLLVAAAYIALGSLDKAERYACLGLTAARRSGNPLLSVIALNELADVYVAFSLPSEAVAVFHAAMALCAKYPEQCGREEAALWAHLGCAYHVNGQLTRAQECYATDLALCEKAGDRHGAAVAYANIGHAYVELGRFSRAITQLESAFCICRDEINDRFGESNAHMQLGWAYFHADQLDKALSCFKLALHMCSDVTYDRTGQTEAHQALADLYRVLLDRPKAIVHYLTQLQLCVTDGDFLGQADACCDLAGIFASVEEYATAILLFRTALDCLRRCRPADKKAQEGILEADVWNQLAAVYLECGRLEQAMECGERALVVSRSVDDPTGVGAACGTLGTVHFEMGDFEVAAQLQRQSLTVYQRCNDHAGQAAAHSNLAYTLMAMGHGRAARTAAEQALHLARHRIADLRLEAEAQQLLGQCYMLEGRFEAAAKALNAAALLFKGQVQDMGAQAEALRLLSEAQYAMKHFREASKTRSSYARVADSVFSTASTTGISRQSSVASLWSRSSTLTSLPELPAVEA